MFSQQCWNAVITVDLSIAARHTFKFARNGDLIVTTGELSVFATVLLPCTMRKWYVDSGLNVIIIIISSYRS